MKGLFLIVEEHEGWASYRHLDPVPPLSSKGKASTECTAKVSTKLFVFQGVILKLNHALKMHVLLYSAPSEELLVFPSLRTLTQLVRLELAGIYYSSNFLGSCMLWCQRNLGSRLPELLFYFPSPR